MDKRILDYVEILPTPGPKFNENLFFLKGAPIIEDLICDILKDHENPKSLTFSKKILALKGLGNRAALNRLTKSLHVFRQCRNEYAHNTRTTKTAKRREKRFINRVEKAGKYNGINFPIPHKENKRQWRLYLAYSVVWENLFHMARPNEEFYPIREMLNAMIVAVENANQNHS
jgi:hypothetical protein